MADDDFVIEVTLNASNATASARTLANILAELRATATGADPAFKKLEADLAKFGGTAKNGGKGVDSLTQSLSTTRYAMYSASNTLGILGAAMIAVAVLPSKVAIEFERSFANVKRTVSGASDVMKQSLIQLSTVLPKSFADLTDIAALGGQLGIGSKGIVDFTKVVAELTATTNLSQEAAGTALGRFQALLAVPASQFENLASSILKVGVNSVATETQIVGIATGIAGISKVAGLTAPQVIGLSGALASIGAQPYASRGTVTRLFTKIQAAVASGGEALNNFAKVAGVSSDTFAKAFGTAKFSPILTKLVEGFSDVSRNGGDAIKTIHDLGITSVIDVPILLRLSQATNLLASSQRDAKSGYADTSTLTKQYGEIAKTAASRITELGNQFQAFLNALGSGTAGPLGSVADSLKDFLGTLTGIASNPVIAWITGFVAVLIALLGVLLLVGAGALRGAAGIIGMSQALVGLGFEIPAGMGLLAGLKAQLIATGTAGKIAAKGLTLAGVAVKALGVATIILGAVSLGSWLLNITDAAKNTEINLNKLVGSSKSAKKELDRIIGAGTGSLNASTDNTLILPVKAKVLLGGGAAELFKTVNTDIAKMFADKSSVGGFLDNAIGGAFGRASGLTQSTEAVAKIDDALAKMVKGGNAKEAARDFNILAAAAHKGGATWEEINAPLVKYNALLAEQTKQNSAAGVANQKLTEGLEYQINITKILSALGDGDAKAQAKFGEAYAKSVGSLTDFNSIIGQVQDNLKNSKKGYDGQSVSLAQFTSQLEANNATQTVWAANLIRLNTETAGEGANSFIQAGYSAVNASILQQLVDATPAQRDEYIAAQEAAARLASQATANALLASGHIEMGKTGRAIGQDTADALALGLSQGIPIEQLMHDLNLRFSQNPLIPVANTDPAQGAINSLISINNGRLVTIRVRATDAKTGAPINAGVAGLFGGAFASGGKVYGPGTGTSDSIHARLSAGEYVIKAASVRKYGAGLFDSLNRGVARFASGGSVGHSILTPPARDSGIPVVQWSAYDRAVMQEIAARIGVTIAPAALAGAVGNSDSNNSRRRTV